MSLAQVPEVSPLPTGKLTLIQAIARQEGFYKEGSLAQRRNNPGNIEEGRFAQAHGALPSDGSRYAAWITPMGGFLAMHSLLLHSYLGHTLRECIYKWAPPPENDSESYLNNICEWTGLTAATIIMQADLNY